MNKEANKGISTTIGLKKNKKIKKRKKIKGHTLAVRVKVEAEKNKKEG